MPSPRLASVVLLCALSGAAEAAEPRTRPATPSSRAAPTAGVKEFRFDALRIDGELQGPEVLVVTGLGRDPRPPLHRRGRSFRHRIFETIESPGLHGGGDR